MKRGAAGMDVALELMSECGNISVADLMSNGRQQHAVSCRYLLFRFMYEDLFWSTPRIGRFFNRNHATVIHGIKQARDYISLPSYENERSINDDFIERLLIHENEN